MTEPDEYDFEAWLRLHAKRLNGRWWRWPLVLPSYDVLADALIWPDEVPMWAPSQVYWALRFVRHYRTGLILGQDRPHRECFELGQRLFPDWVGFHASRCCRSRKHEAIYRAAHIATLQCVDKLEEEIEQADSPPGE